MHHLERNNNLEALVENLHFSILVIEPDTGKILYHNKEFCEDFRCESVVLGTHFETLLPKELVGFLSSVLKGRSGQGELVKTFYRHDRSLWEQATIRMIRWGQGEQVCLLTVSDITQISRSEYAYRQMAFYDSLLDLPNGRKMEEDLAAFDSYEASALIHFDIDKFSSVNDLYGWDAGDHLLFQIRDWLLSTLRRTSRLYRVNDDEFCLLIREISIEEAKKRTSEVLDRFTKPWELLADNIDYPLYCTVTLGLVYGRFIQGEMRNLLYRTLHSPFTGPEGYIIYNEAADKQLRDNLLMRQNLINSIQQGMKGFEVYYHPIISAVTGKWIGAEALCRWFDPNGKMVSPLFFIEVLERMGLIGILDDWVRRTAMIRCMELGLTKKQFILDVNVSPTQKFDVPFIDNLLTMINEIGYPKDKLNLEITESEKMNFTPENLMGLNRLYKEGIQLSLDDFGTGYSSFNNLANMPAKALKTERAFIIGIENNKYLQFLLQEMVRIAHQLDMVLIAEGVETEKQQQLLISYGVDYLQGYLYSKPLSDEDFSKQCHQYM